MIIPIKEKEGTEIFAGTGVQGVSISRPSESRVLEAKHSFSGRNGDFEVSEFHSKEARRYLYSSRLGKDWQHPWYVDLFWSDDLMDSLGNPLPSGWGAKVKAGFVNGMDPVVNAAERIPAYSLEPGSGQAWTDAPGLLDEPLIALSSPSSWKVPESVPYLIKVFFSNLLFDDESVKNAKNKIQAAAAGGGGRSEMVDRLFELATEFDETIVSGYKGDTGESYREILRTEFYLMINRAVYKKEVIASNLFAESEARVSFDNLGLAQNPRPRLAFGNVVVGEGKGVNNSAGKQYDPFKAGGGTDAGIDYLRLGTVYAISSEKETRYASSDEGPIPVYDNSATPGEDWEMYVQHDIFWNLQHRARNLVPLSIKPANSSLGLAAAAGPLGMTLALPLVAMNNVMNSMINETLNDLLNNRSNTGLFWTI